MISVGRTECEVEADTCVEGFRDMLNVLNYLGKNNAENVRTIINQIKSDSSISNEEKESLIKPYYVLLDNKPDVEVRIRRCIFIGIMSLWEVSLRNFCQQLQFLEEKNSNRYNAIEKALSNKSNSDRYATLILGKYKKFYPNIKLINENFNELRNYFVHGSMFDGRNNKINEMIKLHPEFGIEHKTEKEESHIFYFSTNTGIESILNFIVDNLNSVRARVRNIIINKTIKTQSR